MKIKLSKSELIEILQSEFKTTGEVEFVFKNKTIKAGLLDGVQLYDSIRVFDSVEIKIDKIKTKDES